MFKLLLLFGLWLALNGRLLTYVNLTKPAQTKQEPQQ